ncbi:hypothetical protein LTR85_010716 [Meristemomyces frigidus]|nr:hypothetical protein LTR85_010716 [Meristemomyces frigidus]
MDDKKVPSATSGSAYSTDGAVIVDDGYGEYLRLNEVYTGDRLKKLLRKVDLHVIPQLVLIYLLAYIDRANAGNAKLFGALTDMHMSGQDWNTAICVFFATYALGCVPSNIALKKFGPRFWLPSLLTACGIMTICTGLQSTMGGFTAFRLLLGIVEAGIYPGCSFILTNWYTSKELQTRMSVFYSAASLAGAFSGLLAYAIGHLDYTWGYRGWRFIYVIEGLIAVVVGLCGFLFVNQTPAGVKWLTAEEKQYLILRRQFAAGDGGKTGTVAQADAFSWHYAKQASRSIHVYAVAATEFTVAVVVYGISYVLPTIIAGLGYSAVKAQAMTAPPYVFACIFVWVSGLLADRFKARALSVIIPNAIAAIGFVIIIASVRYDNVPGVTYFGLFLMAAGLYAVSPAVMAWTALNMAGSMKRAVGMALMLSISQLGGIMGSNIFLADEAPTYPTGFGICLTMLVLFGVIWPTIYYFILRRINQKRDGISEEEVMAKYSEEELAEMGDESPLFRYAL